MGDHNLEIKLKFGEPLQIYGLAYQHQHFYIECYKKSDNVFDDIDGQAAKIQNNIT